MNDRVRLGQLVEETHDCDTEHTRTVNVEEDFQEGVAWIGEVEVFAVSNHPQAREAYAWTYHDDDGTPHHVVVLGTPPTKSAADAVRMTVEEALSRGDVSAGARTNEALESALTILERTRESQGDTEQFLEHAKAIPLWLIWDVIPEMGRHAREVFPQALASLKDMAEDGSEEAADALIEYLEKIPHLQGMFPSRRNK